MDNVWQELCCKDKLQYLRNTGHLADCTFVVVEDESNGCTTEFQLHKWVLTCASPVFERMLHGDFKESSSSLKITITNTNPEDFNRMIDYIYLEDNEKIKHFEVDTLKNLYYLADRYMLLTLKDSSKSVIKTKLGALNMCALVSAFEFAHLIGDKDMLTIILKTMCSKGIPITSPRIYDMTLDMFYEFLMWLKKSASVTVASNQIRFDLIEAYVKMNNLLENVQIEDQIPIEATGKDENQKMAKDKTETLLLFQGKKLAAGKIVKIMWESIDFMLMSAKDFCNGPGKLVFLDTNQKYDILVSIVNK